MDWPVSQRCRPLRRAVGVGLSVALLTAGCSSSAVSGTGSSGAPATGSATAGGSGTTSSRGSATATLDPLTGRQTTLDLDAGFLGALTTLTITPGLVGRATLASTTVTFPITGGRLVVGASTVTGRVQHDGSGLSLASGSVKVGLVDLVVDETGNAVSSRVTVNGTTAVRSAPILDLDPATRRTSTSGGTTTLSGETARLSAAGAALFNGVFRTTAFTAHLPVGALTVTATG